MDFAVGATTFALVLLAELPDKTALAALVLSTRYRGLLVWYGAALAFAVQVALAVAAGGLLSLLPERPVRFAAAALFALGAVVALRGADDDDPGGNGHDGDDTPARITDTRGWRVVATSFAVLFLAEWGDFTQIAIATLAARHADPLSVAAGGWLALATVGALAVTLGRTLLRVVPLSAVRRLAGLLFAVVAVLALVEAIRA